jgi:hypothetical protein
MYFGYEHCDIATGVIFYAPQEGARPQAELA